MAAKAQQTCNTEDFRDNRCEGVRCTLDGQCQSGTCFDNMLHGKDTCSKSNTCASTPFNHYGRCDGIECEYNSQCMSNTCQFRTCGVNRCYSSIAYERNRCDGQICQNSTQCYGFCHRGYCSTQLFCSSGILDNYRCNGISCTSNVNCNSNYCEGETCSSRSGCASEKEATSNKCEAVRCVSNSECKAFNGVSSCISGYCSTKANCSSTILAASKRCEGLTCSYNSQCITDYCVSGVCKEQFIPPTPTPTPTPTPDSNLKPIPDAPAPAKLPLGVLICLYSIPVLLVILIIVCLRHRRRNNLKHDLSIMNAQNPSFIGGPPQGFNQPLVPSHADPYPQQQPVFGQPVFTPNQQATTPQVYPDLAQPQAQYHYMLQQQLAAQPIQKEQPDIIEVKLVADALPKKLIEGQGL